MDSLLANYGGSDDEADTDVNQAGHSCVPVAASNKPVASTRSSLFSSLPPPTQGSLSAGSAGERLKQGITGALPPPRNHAPKSREEDGYVVDESLQKNCRGQNAGAFTRKLSALLPLPKHGGGSGASGPQKKKTVEFKPPVNIALLEKDAEDERPAKKSGSSSTAVSASGKLGLAAILPPPKHSLGVGAALGSGAGLGGRRTVMETQTRLSSDSDTTTAPVCYPGVEQGTGVDTANYSQSEVFQGSDSYVGQLGPQQGPVQGQEQGSAYQEGSYSADQSWQYDSSYMESGYEEAPSAAVPDDPLTRVLQSERKRGRPEVVPNVIEVKQSDLTGGKLRQDKLKPTGIAFGPAYQPVASNKDKPSKLHRRKHQIGSLYFDMKQREMELLERRSRGQMTKAETQAKYGW